MRKKYHSPELRHEAIRQVVEYRQTVNDVAGRLHVGRDTVRVWVRRHREMKATQSASPAAGPGPDTIVTEHERLRRMIESQLLRKAG